MSSTIENTNTNILKKINELTKILNIYNQYALDKNDLIEVKKYFIQLGEIESAYEFGSIGILSNYYQNMHDPSKKVESYKEYMNFITTENIISRLKRIYTSCKKYLSIYEIDSEELHDAFRNYEFTPVTIKYTEKTNTICECGKPYHIESKNSEFICYNCGKTEKLYGIVFEDEQFWYQEGQRTKHGKYDPTKHCKFWVDRIQAKENTEIPKKVIKAIKKCLIRDNIWLEQLDCSMIRAYLKALKMTKYNDHVSLIKKIITGKEPNQLTDTELKLIYIYFSRIIQIYNKTKPLGKPNCPYHPFFIYKILEHILSDQPGRRDNILSCIHLQSRETLIENDRIWKRICDEIDEFNYTPTDSS